MHDLYGGNLKNMEYRVLGLHGYGNLAKDARINDAFDV